MKSLYNEYIRCQLKNQREEIFYEEMYEKNNQLWIGMYDANYFTRWNYYICIR